MESIWTILAILITTIFTVAGDSYLKKASEQANNFLNTDFLVGLIVYITTAFMWVGIYKLTKFSLAGVIYSLMSIVIFVGVGMFAFHEKLTISEYLGVGMAVSSVFLLSRFL